MAENEAKKLPPYLPYKSFGTFTEHLRAIGVPSHIDKSVMASMSGGMQSWLKAGLRYMKLINADDEPTPLLERLVHAEAPEARKAVLLEIFKATYAFLDGKVELAKTTPVKLKAAVAEEGAQGETIDKIIAFMIGMAKDAGVTLNQLLTKRAPSVRKPRTKPTTKPGVSINMDDDALFQSDDDDASQGEAMKTIALPNSGGTITLTGNVNLFALVGAERDLVFKLIDVMREFEEAQGGGE